MDKQEIEFLKESNAIEREYSEKALEDAQKAWEYAKSFPIKIDIAMIRTVHKLLMKRLDSRIAGQIRTIQVGVMTKDGFREGTHWSEIDSKLLELTRLIPVTEELIRLWHVQFENIHPFEDGNGRTGRILMNVQRLKIGLPVLIIHEGEEQQEYYTWFKEKKND